MSPNRHGGWHKPQPAWSRRSRTALIATATATANAPKASWWTTPVQSREDFDRLAAERSREAGWVGRTSQGHGQ